ncbi:hypothetical protein RJ55_05324 [Drechmeria coniospora]|nr:hypothetical protein RJ55_05324 [Drechmeria coniospora]
MDAEQEWVRSRVQNVLVDPNAAHGRNTSHARRRVVPFLSSRSAVMRVKSMHGTHSHVCRVKARAWSRLRPVYSNYQCLVYSNHRCPVYGNYQCPVYSNHRCPVYSNYRCPVYSNYRCPVYSNYRCPVYSNCRRLAAPI